MRTPFTDAGPFRRLLVGTDFSRGAGLALSRAAILPLTKEVEILLIHVTRPEGAERHHAQAMKEAKRQLDAAAKTLRQQAAAAGVRPSITTELCEGQPHVELIRRSRALEAELILIGHHGQRRVRELLLGNTAHQVIRHGDVPVLIVNAPAKGAYKRPVLASDLGDTSVQMAELTARVAPNVPVPVVHAYDLPFSGLIPAGTRARPSEFHREVRDEAAKALDHFVGELPGGTTRWIPVLKWGDARAELQEELGTRRADLAVLGTHGRTGLAHALMGSTVEWIASVAKCDVLVARPARFSFSLP